MSERIVLLGRVSIEKFDGGIGIILNKHENECYTEPQYTFEIIGPTYEILFDGKVYKLTWIKILRNSKLEIWENVYYLDSGYSEVPDHLIPHGFVNFI